MTRVLIIAEAANSEMVSVPLVGWSIAMALRRVADVHIVTQIRNRKAFLRAGLTEGTDFTAIDSEALAAPIYKFSGLVRGGAGKGWTTAQAINAISYVWFERLVWQQFGGRIGAGEWDVVHRITPLSPTVSSSIAPRCAAAGVPFVLGPLNGGVPWPAAFDGERRAEREWLSYVRGAYKALPGRTRMLRAAAAILVGSRFTESEVPDRHRARCVYLPENAIDPDRFNRPATPGRKAVQDGGPLRVCFVGRLVPYKGVDMLIEAALPLLRQGRLRIDIVGDGPMATRSMRRSRGEGVEGAVVRHGWLDHRQVQDVMADCDLFGFPSIREFGGGVVLEAMALGLPPLVVDYAGPGELVRPGLGYTVPIGTREEIVAGFAARLEAIVADPSGLSQMGKAARARVESHFTWDRKAAQIAEVYDWVLGRRADRLDPFAGDAADGAEGEVKSRV